ncbi:MAG TPA: class I adenylate-forming enzyme family protein [Gordonia sp. (in: high G+C Gram-positive bacteria)]|uniref:class I adenylate-forming enzyme family protein n=1 Tax=unclassified Gordonia (in: high G+C Gram-positive bacteria) TaxID=2657482 RepID=UPI0025BCC08C|nr:MULTISPECIES: class I adenylate-forming enzyme family protein [unclassified Gordonia (in: high G+C Gram-positive bacteria)]HNP56733.1 class I adenylate-forming enzyme family protein [Gordonia sp. (in: high G+C Gram-positive bacteria)]HRC51889.1 class I adenylate-forming enzyme family protein [Gordonia sp. (in: high G+C Gram-positive bacteria)]
MADAHEPSTPQWIADAISAGPGHCLQAGRALSGTAPALLFEAHQWSYDALDGLVDDAAAAYREVGVLPGARAMILMDNRPEFVIALIALTRLGVAVCTPNASWTRHELEPIIDDLAPRWILCDEEHAWAEHRGCSMLPTPTTVARPSTALRGDYPALPTDAEIYLPMSSGTTGRPKGVRHTVGSLVGGVCQIAHHLGLTRADRIQVSVPLCHLYGATMTLAALSVGATVTLFRRFDLDACLDTVEAQGSTVVTLAGPVLHRLAERDDLARRNLKSLRYFMWGGSAIPAAAAESVTATTGVGFLLSYGMTEAVALAFNPVDRPQDWSLRSPGSPTIGTTWRIAGGGSGPGELEVASIGVAAGYATPQPDSPWLSDGWFRTGDIAVIDGEGVEAKLTIVDRAKDMIKVSGFQVSPVEVEQTIAAASGVADCGVFAVPDERRGQSVIAVVVVDPATHRGSSAELEASLRDWAHERLASYKRPTSYLFVDDLPRSPSGKLLRRRLAVACETLTS